MIPRADQFIGFPLWTETLRDEIPGDGMVPIYRGEPWQIWVDRFKQASDGDVIDIPRSTDFQTFEAWADEFIRRNE